MCDTSARSTPLKARRAGHDAAAARVPGARVPRGPRRGLPRGAGALERGPAQPRRARRRQDGHRGRHGARKAEIFMRNTEFSSKYVIFIFDILYSI